MRISSSRAALVALIALCALTGAVFAQEQCQIPDVDKTDCGYVGINQQLCEAKGCCWVPVPHATGDEKHNLRSELTQPPNLDVPWCFFKAGSEPCQDISFDGVQGPGFDDAFYNSMYNLYLANLDIDGKGGVCASPDRNTPGGSYYYDWMRDGALSWRTYLEINDFNLPVVQDRMKAYVQWVLHVQNEPDPNGIDIRTEPKFNLPDGSVYTGGWCRPQTDGPGLRSATLQMFANLLLDNNQDSYVYQYLWTKDGSYNGGAIKFDLDWIINHWRETGCDLWEEVRSDNFFWNRMAFRYTLSLAEKFAQRVGDSASASKYADTRKQIEDTLDGHWNGQFMFESTNREKDAAVTHAFSSFPGYYAPTDSKVAATIKTLNKLFCTMFQINQDDNKKGIPGILYGRYQGDQYAGGNPWQLLTAVLGELFYQGATYQLQRPANEVLSADMVNAWSDILKLDATSTTLDFANKSLTAGDAVLYRLYLHVKDGSGHINEQINKVTGIQMAAKDLTWSFANIMRALHYRQKAVAKIAEAQAALGEQVVSQ